jgi:PPK2 family polyphosphate:nucleotide phosphotransferase
MSYAHKLDKPQKVTLDDYDPDDMGKTKKDKGLEELAELNKELGELQEWLYAAQQSSVLIVLQGLDTSGKDGTISHVMSSVNPQGCDVASFKVPTPQEATHDFLWRIHRRTPAKGMMTIFNRSHYEDVLVTRVHDTITHKECERRYQDIRNFEQLLAEDHTLIMKFFLHISPDEQEKRLVEREKDEEKSWKLSPGDWEERQFWPEYQKAYQTALGATAEKHAPWYIVPANHKWYRNLAIAETIVKTLHEHKKDWQETLKTLGEQRRAELDKMRKSGEIPKPDQSNPFQTH